MTALYIIAAFFVLCIAFGFGAFALLSWAANSEEKALEKMEDTWLP